MMQNLNLPPCNLTVKTGSQNKYIFDIIRKKYVVLTGEEWVRQNFVHFLVYYKHCPTSLMKTEDALKVFGTSKRSDIVVYNNNGVALMVVECKDTSVAISRQTFQQIERYNITLKAKCLIVTNGLKTFCMFENKNNCFEFVDYIPDYSDLIG